MIVISVPIDATCQVAYPLFRVGSSWLVTSNGTMIAVARLMLASHDGMRVVPIGQRLRTLATA